MFSDDLLQQLVKDYEPDPLQQLLDTPSTGAAPVYRLPAELLIEVFADIADLDGDINASDIVSISHVCGYWRKVALNTPFLWTCVDAACIGFENFVTRSNPLPIRLHLVERDQEVTLEQRQGVISRFQELLSRAESLTAIGSYSVLESLLDATPLHLPTLRSLKLIIERDYESSLGFKHDAPNIKMLHLSGVNINLAGLSLTTFHYHGGAQREDEHRPSRWDIVELLRRSPSIRSFVLIPGPNLPLRPHTIPRTAEAYRSRIELDKLETFSIKVGRGGSNTEIWPFIHIPNQAPLFSRGPYQCLTMGWGSKTYAFNLAPYGGPQNALLISGRTPLSKYPRIAKAILSCFDTQSLTRLWLVLKSGPVCDESEWNWILSRMPALVYINLKGNASTIEGFLLALWPLECATGNWRYRTPPPCPKIRHMRIERLDDAPLGAFFKRHVDTAASLKDDPLKCNFTVNFMDEVEAVIRSVVSIKST